MTATNITSKYEEERQRNQEQSQILHLQGQIDELRRQIKDQTSKYHWVGEQQRRMESAVTQLQESVVRQVDEITQSHERIRKDISTLRGELGMTMMKVDDSLKPLREMQSQIFQIAEARKQDRDFIFPWFARVETLEQQTNQLQAQLRDRDEDIRNLESKLRAFSDADIGLSQEIQRLSDSIRVEKQNVQRQAVEVQQSVTDVRVVLDEYASRVARVEDLHQQALLFAESLPTQITDLAAKLPSLVEETKRVERISTERFLMNQERLEEVRTQTDARIEKVQEAEEIHTREAASWLERVEASIREDEQRLQRITLRLETLQQINVERLTALEQREVQVLNSLSASFAEQLERVKAAQLAVGAPPTSLT